MTNNTNPTQNSPAQNSPTQDGPAQDGRLRYADFAPTQRFQPSIAISPDGTHVAYSTNADNAFNLWIQPTHDGTHGDKPRRLTAFTDVAVRQVAWSPDSHAIAFAADRNGDDQFQIYLARIDTPINTTIGACEPTRLTHALDREHALAYYPFSPNGRFLAYATNDRDRTIADLIIHDLQTGERRRIESTPGINLIPDSFSPDGRWLLIAGARGNTDIECLILDLNDPAARPEPLAPRETDTGTYAHPGPWTPDSTGFYFLTDAAGGHVQLAHYDLHRRTWDVRQAPDWDIAKIVAARHQGTLVWEINDDGRSHLRTHTPGQQPRSLPLPPGVVQNMDIDAGGRTLALLIESATRPTDVATLNLTTGDLTYLTDNRPPALHAIQPVPQQHVTYPAPDGRTIHAQLYRPHGHGPFPALLSIHGGPAAQERPEYAHGGLYQHLLANGIAILAPNIRGSLGYGRDHHQLIYGDWGGGDLTDLLAATDYLHTLDWIDPTRIAVFGRSYGGFAALTCLTQHPDQWAAGVSVYGPTDLNVLARDAPPTAHDFIVRMLGDPDDPTDAARLHQRSPITHADKITTPILITQGTHDSRVPKPATDRIVALLRAKNIPVTYLVYNDEGHGFTNRNNEIHAYTQISEFLTHHLTQDKST